jgi:hypothetical protein
MWIVRIDGNPTVICKSETAGITSYQEAQHWTLSGHRVELFFSNRRVFPQTSR